MDAGIVVRLIVVVVFGVACAMIAQNRGRSAVAWFFIGVFLGCIGLILLLALPNLKLEQERHEQLRRENRRLRERLRKDRQTADQRHQSVTERLGIHDEALGLDTAKALEGPAETPAHLAGGPPPPPRDWYYLIGQERFGPVAEPILRQLWREGRIDATTLVWCKEMRDWQPIGELPDLQRGLDG